MLKIAMIAGEASGDLLASDLIRAIKLYHPDAQFVGIGGSYMQSEGFISWYDINRLSIIGIVEVVKNLPQLLMLRYKIIRDIIKYKPDVFIGVDAPDFNFFVEKKLKQKGIKTIHYISPSIWAWRYNRIYKIKKTTNALLCLFPFEPNIYAKHLISAEFIGHPLAAIIEYAPDTIKYRQDILGSSMLTNQLTLTILCGSRTHEIEMLLPSAVAAANIISDLLPKDKPLIVIFPVSKKMVAVLECILSQCTCEFFYKIVIDNTLSAIKACDIALVKSGTVSLEVALCKKPMVIFYKLQALSAYFIAKRLTVKFVGLANIIATQLGLDPIVPELLQDQVNASKIAQQLMTIYHDKSIQDKMIKQFQVIHKSLNRPHNYKELIDKIIN
jgi:lipid-A-disaccharide synthase